MMIEFIDSNGNKRTGIDGSNQYLDEAVGVFPPRGETWHLADTWSLDLAAKLIATGWPNLDIEADKVDAKLAICKRSDAAKGRLRAYSHFVELATIAIKDGILSENDSPDAWLEWAQSKNYKIGHLTKYLGRSLSDEDAAFFAGIDAMLEPFLKPIDYGHPSNPLATADVPKVSKGKAGRPKTIDKKVQAVRDMIARFECAASLQFTPQALSGSAADLLDACKRFEKSNKIKPLEFSTSIDTFNGWLKSAGYSFPTGRTPDIEKNYWTQLVVKVRV